MLAFAIFNIAAGLLLLGMAIYDAKKYGSAKSGTPTTAIVRSVNADATSTTLTAEYSYLDTSYIKDYSASVSESLSISAGDEIDILLDPDHPERSVRCIRGKAARSNTGILICTIIFIAIGIFLLIVRTPTH